MPMVDKADDAIALWQQMIGEMQKGFRAFGDQLSPGSSDQSPAGPDSPQKRVADLMESYFAGMNLPSRAQLNALSDRLQAIEGELTEIKALLHEAQNPKPAQDAPRPPEQGSKRPNAAKAGPRPRPVPAGQGAPSAAEKGGKPK
jgi:hypothetical protein